MLLPALTERSPPATLSEALPMRAPAPGPEFRITLPPALTVTLLSRGAAVLLVLPRAAPLPAWPPVRITSPRVVNVRSVALGVVPPRPPILEPLAVPAEPPPLRVTL